MTTNLPLTDIHQLLHEANHKDPNIRITPSIGSSIEYLDVYVNNDQGQLKTTVFHKPAAEPYIVPFLSDHPRRIHRNVIRGALFRAVRVCSDVYTFNTERLNIELLLLLNDYPPRFILYHFKKFFGQNNALALMEQLNNNLYMKLHHELIHQLTQRERRQQREDQIYLQSQSILPDDRSQQQIIQKKEIRVSFTFESGPMLDFKDELTRLWKQHYIFKGSAMNNVKLKIGTRRNKSLHQLLSPGEPSKALMR